MTTAADDGFAAPRSLVEEAVRVITERIVRGEFPPGMRQFLSND